MNELIELIMYRMKSDSFIRGKMTLNL